MPLPRVLLVDDEPLIRWAVRETLTAAGCEVVEAGDAASALRAVSEYRNFKLVLLDCHLPDCNGLELLSGITAMLPDTRVVIMTAFMPEDGAERARALGIRVLPKPFDMHDIHAIAAQIAHAA